MGPSKVREEVLNVLLAELLEERGLWSVPESIRRRAGERRRWPRRWTPTPSRA